MIEENNGLNNDRELELINISLTRASSWFQLHANHRMQSMNFYIVLLAGALAALVSVLKDGNALTHIAIGISILMITYSFKNMDKRTASLIKDAEGALCILENKIISKFEPSRAMKKLNLVLLSEEKKGLLSYRQCFNYLFFVGYAIGMFVLFNGCWKLFCK